jgi:prepilin-type N-terminal cleavage/methylation domain-containing protein
MRDARGFTLIELLIVVAIIAIIAAIAVPALLRARMSANEAGAIGDSRAVTSGEASYAAANNGAYGTLTCLNNPQGCGFAASTVSFIDSQLASLQVKQGYARSFVAGTAGGGSPDPGLGAYVYLATPAVAGQTGGRGFAVDASARICFTTDGSAPPLAGPGLDQSCQPLR